MKNTDKTKELDFFEQDELTVPVTYKGHTMTWFLREVYSDEVETLDQVFLKKTKEERKTLEHQHQTKLLTLLMTRPPENPLSGFPETSENFRTEIYDFLTTFRGEVDEKKKKNLVNAVITLYNRDVQPPEFFRSV